MRKAEQYGKVIHQFCPFPRSETYIGENTVQSPLSSPLLSSPLDKTPERQVLGHRMISTRCYRPGEEHALSWMERTAGGEGKTNRAGLNARNLNFTNL